MNVDVRLKARTRRRYVLGLREVTKHLKMRKLKCIIISPNLERIQSKGWEFFLFSVLNCYVCMMFTVWSTCTGRVKKVASTVSC